MAACRALDLRIGAVVPTTAVLERATVASRMTWRDGDANVELVFAEGKLSDVRRVVPAHREDDDDDHDDDDHDDALVPALRELGDDAPRFADAYGAATLPGDEAMSVHDRVLHDRSAGIPRWRVTLATTVMVGALVAALVAPWASATFASRRSASRLAVLGARGTAAAAAMTDLQRVTAALDEVGRFESGRRSATFVMAELTRTLPAEAFMVTVRLDSAGGTFVALAPRAGDVLARLERSGMLVAPEVVGPVTRERVDAAERDRFTVRFRWADAPSRKAHPPRT
jgi:hypothetical protein